MQQIFALRSCSWICSGPKHAQRKIYIDIKVEACSVLSSINQNERRSNDRPSDSPMLLLLCCSNNELLIKLMSSEARRKNRCAHPSLLPRSHFFHTVCGCGGRAAMFARCPAAAAALRAQPRTAEHSSSPSRQTVVPVVANRHSPGWTKRFAVYERDNWTCQYCGSRCSDAWATTTNACTIDHVWPVSLGGTNDMSNLVCACRTCNKAKSSKVRIL